MELVLYQNFSKRINSTKRPSGGVTDYVNLKNNTSINSPVFEIQNVDTSVNYCFCPNFGRYYFITDIVITNAKIYELHCTTDVLATYNDSIGAYSAYIERSASKYNVMFNDPLVSVRQDIVSVKRSLSDIVGISGGDGCYILRIAGGSDKGVSTYASTSISAFGPIFNKDAYIGQHEEVWEEIESVIFDPFKYVVSLAWSPIDFNLISAFGTTTSFIDIKWYAISLGTSVVKLRDTAITNSQTTINKPPHYYSDFRRYNNRFTEYNLYLPGIGAFPFPSELTKDSLLLDYMIDLSTGDIFYSLNPSTASPVGQATVATYSGNIYRQIQIGSDSMNFTAVAQSVGTAIGGVASAIGGNYVGGALTVAGGAIATFENIVSPTPSVMGGDGASISVKLEPHIVLSQTVRGSGEVDAAQFGRPCCEVTQISTLSGFVKCGGASLEISGLSQDSELVNSYLNSGFYYE